MEQGSADLLPPQQDLAASSILTFSDCTISRDAVECRPADSVTCIVLQKCNKGKSEVWKNIVFGMTWFNNLNELRVFDTNFIKPLSLLSMLLHLKKLVLARNSISSSDLSNIVHLPSLHELSITDNPVNREDSEAIVLISVARKLPNLNIMDIPFPSANTLYLGCIRVYPPTRDATTRQLMLMLGCTLNVKQLTMKNTKLGEDGLMQVLKLLSTRKIKSLDLSENKKWCITEQTIGALGQLSHSLQSLKLQNCSLQDEKFNQLTCLGSLKSLVLNGNLLTAGAMNHLAAEKRILECLNLSNNPIKDKGALILADSQALRQLTALSIQQCQVGPKGLVAIASSATTLKTLFIKGNRIDEEAVRVIVSRLPALETIGLDNTGLSSQSSLVFGAAYGSKLSIFLSSNGILASQRRRLRVMTHPKNKNL